VIPSETINEPDKQVAVIICLLALIIQI